MPIEIPHIGEPHSLLLKYLVNS